MNYDLGGKGRNLTQGHNSPHSHRKLKKAKWQHNNATSTSIAQRWRTDLGRSVPVTKQQPNLWNNHCGKYGVTRSSKASIILTVSCFPFEYLILLKDSFKKNSVVWIVNTNYDFFQLQRFPASKIMVKNRVSIII